MRPGFRVHEPAGAYYVMTDIADLAADGEDDVAFALRLIRDPGVAAVPGSSFFSHPDLGRTKLRFAFPKRHETLVAAADRLARLATARLTSGQRAITRPASSPMARRASSASKCMNGSGLDRLLDDLAADPAVDDRVDRPGPIGLEGRRDRVGPAAVEHVGQRLDAVVADPAGRVGGQDPGEVAALVEQVGRLRAARTR